MPRKLRLAALALAALAAAAALGGWCCYPVVDADPAQPGQPGLAVDNQEQHAARGFGTASARVDSQITLRIPEGQADAVYEYLKARYVGQDHLLAERFPGLRLTGKKMSDVSLFTDEYYDTPALDLYRHKNSARHRVRVNTTNPGDRKSGRELVQMKVTPPGQFTLRTELKYEVREPARARTVDDVHPLIRLIADKQRRDFKQVYFDAGINPYSLRHVCTIEQTRSRGYLDLDGKNIFSFSVDVGSASILWARGSYSSVDLGLVEIAYTEADEAGRKQMWAIREAIIEDLVAHFPGMTQNDDSKYSIVLQQILEQMPLIPLLLRLRLL